LLAAKARSIFEMDPTDKMHVTLVKEKIPAYAVKIQGTVDVWISFPSSFLINEVQQQLLLRNFDILSVRFKEYRIVELRIPTNRINELSSLPFIEYIQPIPHEAQLLNNNSRIGTKANIANGSLAVGGRNLHGEGIVIGVGDNADPQYHVDFTGRTISRFGIGSGQHGLHVAGTSAGAGILTDTLAGYAPKATMIVQNTSNVIDYSATYVQDYGMVITNNSYGAIVGDCGYNGMYDLYSRIVDQQIIDLPNLTHVFASGNSGALTCSPYPAGFKTVLGSYQSTKNALIVGAVTSTGLIAGFSSKGPVIDGRIKPEIVTQGSNVISAGFGSYWNNSGTSMACPGATGGMALLYQRYKQLNGESNPKNGLMKNIICNTAMDRGNDGPDYSYGFGWMNVARALEMMESNRYLNATIANAVTNNHSISIPANTAQLKVMLYWNDPAASAIASKILVNDLDLEVINTISATILPRVLDTIPANVNNVAGNGVDHINNIEQVTINNPAAGNYTVRIKGTAITQNPSQEYFVSWEIIPVSTKITFPIGEESFRPGQMITVQWENYGAGSSFTLQYSVDNGSNWTDADNNIPSTSIQYNWIVPNITSDLVRVRIINNTTGAVSGSAAFNIIGLPAVTLAPVQCEDYISINWNTIPGATDYEVMRLIGDDMVPVAVVPNSTTTYTFSGLSKDSVYWVSVRPRLNGKPGRRATAISRQPNNGTCTGAISDNDLKLYAIITPTSSGRVFTSTELTSTQSITVSIKNLDDIATVGNIDVTYQLNAGTPVTETIINPNIAPGTTYNHVFGSTVNLSSPGTYTLKLTVTGTGDIVTANNSVTKFFKQLDNPAITLSPSFFDDLETIPSQSVQGSQMGLAGSDRFDFSVTNPFGRLRTFVNTGIAYSGNRAITLDASRGVAAPGNSNFLDGTYNLAMYTANTAEIRLDFRYKHHGQITNANNRVWVRGNDTQPWVQVYDLFANQNDIGIFKKTASIEVSDFLNSNAQNFSTSFQIRWGQWGTLQAADDKGGAGYTIDDIQVYQVTDDIQMVSIDSPFVNSCGLSGAVPVKITLKNSMGSVKNNIPVKIRVDGGTIISETVASVAANSNQQYNFISTVNLTALGIHTIQVWVDYPTDSYRLNDTTVLTIVNMPMISTFPYLENFEASNGNWYTEGKNNSWQYGTPASNKINGAASGSKAWKTNLAGNYNDREKSYLYSPCFNVTGLSNPTLSFNVALDLEDCGGTLCDGTYIEYSADGITWTRLGASGQGTNWYNKNYTNNNLWSVQNYNRWHVATIPLPTGLSQLRLRFVMQSDPLANRDGVAIDDIHVYNNPFGIYDGVTMASPISQTISGGTNWIDFTASGKLIASVQPNNQNLGITNAQTFINTVTDRSTNGQYYHDRNLVINPAIKNLNDSVTVRFYFLDKETDSLIFATGCTVCTKPTQFTQLGITEYSDTTKITENGLLTDNGPGNWKYFTASRVTKVPFDKGYYAEFKTKNFSEFWLNDGGIDKVHPFPVELLNFTAVKDAGNNVHLDWTTAFEFGINKTEIEVAKGNANLQQNNFTMIGTVNSAGNSAQPQSYNFTDAEANKSDIRYYRLKIIHNEGVYSYSAIKPVVFDNALIGGVFPNPTNGIFNLSFQAVAGEKIQAKLFDTKGRVLRNAETIATGDIQKFVLDISDERIPPGVYMVRVNLGTIVKSYKVIKQ
jgi:Subtilase family/Secretion system C-terminal sorting domain